MAYAAVAMAAATEPKHRLATLAPLAAHSRRPPHGLISAPTAPSSRSSGRAVAHSTSAPTAPSLASDNGGDCPNLQQGTSKPPAAVGSHELEGAHDPNFRASGCSWIPQVRGRPLPPGAGHPAPATPRGRAPLLRRSLGGRAPLLRHSLLRNNSSTSLWRPSSSTSLRPLGPSPRYCRPHDPHARPLGLGRPSSFIWCFDSCTAVACAPRAPSGPPRSASSRCSARSSRSATLGQFKMLCAALVTAAHMIFMTGQYLAEAKLFAAPVDLAPVPDAVCRSGA